jgi:hypothetical protein
MKIEGLLKQQAFSVSITEVIKYIVSRDYFIFLFIAGEVLSE